MKRIEIATTSTPEGQTVTEIFKMVLENSPHRALGVEEIRHRVKILDKLDGLNGSGELLLEDAEHRIMSEAMGTFPWSKANRSLLNIIESVTNASEVNVASK